MKISKIEYLKNNNTLKINKQFKKYIIKNKKNINNNK